MRFLSLTHSHSLHLTRAAARNLTPSLPEVKRIRSDLLLRVGFADPVKVRSTVAKRPVYLDMVT